MRTSPTALQLCCLGLGLMVGLLGQGMAAPSPIGGGPLPIDCVYSRWSEWTACDPCGKAPTQRRSRSIEVFGQFGGAPCQGQNEIGQGRACITDAACLRPTPSNCSHTDFQCPSGGCVRNTLKCNGDPDCDDFEDEADCEVIHSPCGQSVPENNEESRTAGYGINILGSSPRMNAFNNDFFNGRCDRVRNPTTQVYDRRPWNVGVLHYETLIEESASREIYEDTSTIMSEIVNEVSNKVGGGVSLKLSASEKSQDAAAGGGAGSGGGAAGRNGSRVGEALRGAAGRVSAEAGVNVENEKSTMIKNLTEYTTIKNKSFMRVRGKVQLSTYRLRSLNLQVTNDFVDSVRDLPLEYEKGRYFLFIEEWGTHYTKNGKSGGEYDLVYVLNKDTINTKKMNEEKVRDCLKVGVTGKVNLDRVDLDGNVNPLDKCTTVNPKPSAEKGGTALVEKVLTSVRGGTAEATAAMKAMLNKEGILDASTFQTWAGSIAVLPALLHSDPEPIHSIIPLDMDHANTKISNVKRGIEDYIAEYNVCKCKPCKNGGTVALIDGECVCLCRPLYEGLACQGRATDRSAKAAIIDQTGTVVAQEGNWACWSSWAGCSGGQRSRTRSCNTGGLTGASCSGETRSQDYC